jgi:hypothetical protein
MLVGTQFVASAWGGTPNEDATNCVPTNITDYFGKLHKSPAV